MQSFHLFNYLLISLKILSQKEIGFGLDWWVLIFLQDKSYYIIVLLRILQQIITALRMSYKLFQMVYVCPYDLTPAYLFDLISNNSLLSTVRPYQPIYFLQTSQSVS